MEAIGQADLLELLVRAIATDHLGYASDGWTTLTDLNGSAPPQPQDPRRQNLRVGRTQ